jgi:hypothetical protein
VRTQTAARSQGPTGTPRASLRKTRGGRSAMRGSPHRKARFQTDPVGRRLDIRQHLALGLRASPAAARFVVDSPLEEDGFEPSVPRQNFCRPSIPTQFTLPQYKPAPSRQGPMVRIHLPPPASLRTLGPFMPSEGRSLEDRACRTSLFLNGSNSIEKYGLISAVLYVSTVRAERCAQLPPSKKLWTISERAI